MEAEDLEEGGHSFFTTFEEEGLRLRVFEGVGSHFFRRNFSLKNHFKMHLIPFKITLQGILNTFIFW